MLDVNGAAPKAAGQGEMNSVKLSANRMSQRRGFKMEMRAKKSWPKARREEPQAEQSQC